MYSKLEGQRLQRTGDQQGNITSGSMENESQKIQEFVTLDFILGGSEE